MSDLKSVAEAQEALFLAPYLTDEMLLEEFMEACRALDALKVTERNLIAEMCRRQRLQNRRRRGKARRR